MSEEGDRLIAEWRAAWNEWNEVASRMELALAGGETPEQRDFDLEADLNKKVAVLEERRQDHRDRLINLLREQ